MSDEIRVVNPSTQFKMTVHPDGSRTVEYNGSPEELSLVLSQMRQSDSGIGYAQLLQWANRLQKLQPLILAAAFCIGCLALLFWATRPGDTYYQPQSQEARYEWPA